ncbi:alpha/beta fold hydrolase [Nocardia sp. alder85J]|uniref:alpha/beta hydrolase family protein n=1 Tax=Nocardia sp. alder85J TaxID=2862949 RepID=UPI001CD5454A|nr:alpha/beta fold hydrolase [Nocardia sp. alder85J]MCX4091554.1 alpha/beta fold hydrolase [Nocardia sp. alder85J]
MSTPSDTSVSGGERTPDFTGLEALPVTIEPSATSAAASFVVRVLPAGDPEAPVLLMLPAMAMKAKFYLPMLAALAQREFNAAAVDLRAQGESLPPLGEARNFGYREMLETDLPAIVAAVRERFPRAPLYLFGHSLGGQLALLYSASAPGSLAGVITIGTGSVYWRSFPGPRRLPVLLGSPYVWAVSRLRGHWAGNKLMAGPMAGGVMADWSRHALTGRYRPRGSRLRYDRLLRENPARVLMLSLKGDPLGPKSTVEFLAGRQRAATVTHRHLDAQSGVLNLDHFTWVKDSPVLSALIADWIRDSH